MTRSNIIKMLPQLQGSEIARRPAYWPLPEKFFFLCRFCSFYILSSLLKVVKKVLTYLDFLLLSNLLNATRVLFNDV